MSKRVLAAVLAVTVTTVSGCAGFCAPDMTNACSPAPEVHHHYHDDDDTDAVLLAVGVTAGVAALIALIAVNRGKDTSAPPAVSQPHAPANTYIVPVPVATSDDDLPLQRMYVQGHLSARAGRCEATVVIGRQLARVSPTYHRQYVADPTVAACLR